MTKFAKAQIARQFSRAAGTYDFVSQLQNEMAMRLIKQIPTDARGELVDLGCGTGWALEQLERSLHIDDNGNDTNRIGLTGIDLAPGMLEVARNRVKTAQFYCRDLEATGIESNFADVVFSNAAIQWCDTKAAFAEMKRIGKPGSAILCSSFGPQTLHEIKSSWRQTGDTIERVHEFESSEMINSKLIDLGFKNVKVESGLREFNFETVRELLLSIKQLGATNASANRPTGLLGTKRYREFCQALENGRSEAGHLTITFECIFLSANA